MPVASTSGSALGCARMKSLPPVSPTSRGYAAYEVRFAAACCHSAWNTSVEPVKWIPANPRSASTRSDTCTDGPGTKLITPGGRPASASRRMTKEFESTAVAAGFHHGVAHDRRGGRQVAADRREVEGRDGVDEALQGTIVEVVPHTWDGQGLFGVNALRIVHVEAEEIDQLARSVDLRLMRGLRLAEHGGAVDDRPVPCRQQLRGLEKHGAPPLKPPRRPLAPRVPSRRDRGLHLRGPRLMRLGEHVAMAMRHHHVHRPAGVDVFATDDEGNLELAAGELFHGPFELPPRRGPRGVTQDRLVDGGRDLGNAVHDANLHRRGVVEHSDVIQAMTIHPKTRIGHVHLTVSDLDQALAFYRRSEERRVGKECLTQ